MNRLLLIAIAAATAACNADLDEQWQLEHDRIIAVRAEPPAILPGEQSSIDLLVGFAENPVAERAPDLAQVVSPMSLAGAVAPDSGGWVVTAPSEDQLAAARTELGLDPGAPVPLQIGVAAAWPNPVMSIDEMHFGAVKTVWLGETDANPTMTGLTIDGVDPGTADLVVPKDGSKVRLFVEGDDTKDIVNWLTSCGQMHDFDAHSAYLTVAPEDPQEGQLAVVFRNAKGGVTWRVWNIRAE
jgi:hypothetical protein